MYTYSVLTLMTGYANKIIFNYTKNLKYEAVTGTTK